MKDFIIGLHISFAVTTVIALIGLCTGIIPEFWGMLMLVGIVLYCISGEIMRVTEKNQNKNK